MRIRPVVIMVLVVSAAARVAAQAAPPTARQIVDRIKAELGGTWTETGTDSFKDGDPATPVTGVAVTMMTTMDVLQRAAAAKLNLIITHEPTFFTGNDALGPLENAHDSLTAVKRAFIKEHHLVVFRLHDHWHYPARAADPVLQGVFRQLDWLRYQQQPGQNAITIPATTVGALAAQLAKTLGAQAVRVVGDAKARVTRVAYLPGSAGFEMQRATLARDDVEVEIIGEAREWETTLYAADLVTLGRRKALITLGHVPSEQAGSTELVAWLQPLLPGVPVKQIATADPYWIVR
jgi:putative NIF3 family GTP cyclohydrolase 1 type 2